MPLNRLFDTIEQARETANWRAAFGEPQAVEDKVIIPVARASFGFGLGFGSSPAQTEADDAPVSEGGGGGGGAVAKPLGAIVVTPETVYFEKAMDPGKVAVVVLLLGGLFVLQAARTLTAIFGRD